SGRRGRRCRTWAESEHVLAPSVEYVTLPLDPRSAYTTGDPAETAPRARKHALVGEVKRVVEHTAMLDIEDVPAEELDALVAQARALADRLEAHPSLTRYGGLASST